MGGPEDPAPDPSAAAKTPKLPKKLYEKELHRLQVETVEMVDWVQRD